MADKPENIEAMGLGCASLIVNLLITGPIWYVLLFGILHRTDAPGWQWALYWVYVPSAVVAQALLNFGRVMLLRGK
jgi:hypothetical protein